MPFHTQHHCWSCRLAVARTGLKIAWSPTARLRPRVVAARFRVRPAWAETTELLQGILIFTGCRFGGSNPGISVLRVKIAPSRPNQPVRLSGLKYCRKPDRDKHRVAR